MDDATFSSLLACKKKKKERENDDRKQFRSPLIGPKLLLTSHLSNYGRLQHTRRFSSYFILLALGREIEVFLSLSESAIDVLSRAPLPCPADIGRSTITMESRPNAESMSRIESARLCKFALSPRAGNARNRARGMHMCIECHRCVPELSLSRVW